MEPSLRDWENSPIDAAINRHLDAAMEPSLRDWENYIIRTVLVPLDTLQWSPVLGTGKT